MIAVDRWTVLLRYTAIATVGVIGDRGENGTYSVALFASVALRYSTWRLTKRFDLVFVFEFKFHFCRGSDCGGRGGQERD